MTKNKLYLIFSYFIFLYLPVFVFTVGRVMDVKDVTDRSMMFSITLIAYALDGFRKNGMIIPKRKFLFAPVSLIGIYAKVASVLVRKTYFVIPLSWLLTGISMLLLDYTVVDILIYLSYFVGFCVFMLLSFDFFKMVNFKNGSILFVLYAFQLPYSFIRGIDMWLFYGSVCVIGLFCLFCYRYLSSKWIA